VKVDAEGAGLDGQRLERITEHLQRRYVDAGRIAGCQVAVMRHGVIGYLRCLGLRDLERDRPVEPDTIWRIYSMSKPITGVALLTLYERGLFQLDDPVTRFIPAWRGLKVREREVDGSERLVEPRRPMTVRDLMMHTSGLSFPRGGDVRQTLSLDSLEPGKGMPSYFHRAGETLESMVDRYASLPLQFHPGTHWLYSVSTDICGRLVEILSGQPFDEYLRSAVFEPLGMRDTGFSVVAESVDRFAASYRRGPDKRLILVDDPQQSDYLTPPTFFSGGAGLVSTIADYMRFCQMLVNGGSLDGVRILGRKTVELMASNHIPGDGDLRSLAVPGGYGEVEFDGMGFGLTVAVAKGPVPTRVVGSPGEYMWGGLASTLFWIDPAEDLAVVFMTQLIPSGTFNFRNQLKAMVYAAIVD
jgi:CubicO group peptidase (beta-lactamase class C family)